MRIACCPRRRLTKLSLEFLVNVLLAVNLVGGTGAGTEYHINTICLAKRMKDFISGNRLKT